MIHVLPTLWFRNTWASDDPAPALPHLPANGSSIEVAYPELPPMTLAHSPDATALFCNNETNAQRLFGVPGRSRHPKDGIGDHFIQGADTVNPERAGTKAAVQHLLTIAPGATAEVRVRLSPGGAPGDLAAGFEQVMREREDEADAFFADLTRPGDPTGPAVAAQRAGIRNQHREHLDAADIIAMSDPWEYPWLAAWDLAFHAVPLAQVDPAFAKAQLLLMLNERYLHPNGQLPADGWSFDDVNPPVHAWASLRVFRCTGGDDFEFLVRMFHRLLINFTWWVSRKDSVSANLFEGGFLGLDNIGAFDRSTGVPQGTRLLQAAGTARLAMYCLDMLEIALELAAILRRMFYPAEFLSDGGIRSSSRHHRTRPFSTEVNGTVVAVGYEPVESQSGLFGGNSNRRGPVWLPVNILLVAGLRRFGRFYGGDLTVEFPTGSGCQMSLGVTWHGGVDRPVAP